MQNGSRWSRLVLAGILLGFLTSFAVTAHAQTPAPTNPVAPNYVTLVGPRSYNVVKGDTLWDLNPNEWRQIQAANPKLNAASRISTTRAGLYRVLLIENEPIQIPAGLTIRIHTSVPAPTVAPTPPAAPPVAAGPTLADLSQAFGAAMKTLWWLLPLLFLLLAAIVIGAGYMMFRALRDLLQTQRNAQERGAIDRHNAVMNSMNGIVDNLAAMEENRRWDDIRRDGLIYALFSGLHDMVTRLQSPLVILRRETRVQAQPRFDLIDFEAIRMAGETRVGHVEGPRDIPANAPIDFYEVHRANGERFSMNVAHGTPVTSVDAGVTINGRVTHLTEEAARYERDRAAGLRRERHAELITTV